MTYLEFEIVPILDGQLRGTTFRVAVDQNTFLSAATDRLIAQNHRQVEYWQAEHDRIRKKQIRLDAFNDRPWWKRVRIGKKL